MKSFFPSMVAHIIFKKKKLFFYICYYNANWQNLARKVCAENFDFELNMYGTQYSIRCAWRCHVKCIGGWCGGAGVIKSVYVYIRADAEAMCI